MGARKKHSEMPMPELDPASAAAVDRFLERARRNNVSDKGGPIVDPKRAKLPPGANVVLPVGQMDDLPPDLSHAHTAPRMVGSKVRCHWPDERCNGEAYKSGLCKIHYPKMLTRKRKLRADERNANRRF